MEASTLLFNVRDVPGAAPARKVAQCGFAVRVVKMVDHAVRSLRGRSLPPTFGLGGIRVSRRRANAQRGQTLIEFALVAPLVLLFLLAVVDFGIAIDRRLVLDHAVREGARYAAVGGDVLATSTPASVSDIQGRTAAHAQGIVEEASVAVCYTDENGNGRLADIGDGVEVRVRYEHDFVTGFTGLFGTSATSIPMNPRASARVERTVEPEPAGACTEWPPP